MLDIFRTFSWVKILCYQNVVHVLTLTLQCNRFVTNSKDAIQQIPVYLTQKETALLPYNTYFLCQPLMSVPRAAVAFVAHERLSQNILNIWSICEVFWCSAHGGSWLKLNWSLVTSLGCCCYRASSDWRETTASCLTCVESFFTLGDWNWGSHHCRVFFYAYNHFRNNCVTLRSTKKSVKCVWLWMLVPYAELQQFKRCDLIFCNCFLKLLYYHTCSRPWINVATLHTNKFL